MGGYSDFHFAVEDFATIVTYLLMFFLVLAAALLGLALLPFWLIYKLIRAW